VYCRAANNQQDQIHFYTNKPDRSPIRFVLLAYYRRTKQWLARGDTRGRGNVFTEIWAHYSNA